MRALLFTLALASMPATVAADVGPPVSSRRVREPAQHVALFHARLAAHFTAEEIQSLPRVGACPRPARRVLGRGPTFSPTGRRCRSTRDATRAAVFDRLLRWLAPRLRQAEGDNASADALADRPRLRASSDFPAARETLGDSAFDVRLSAALGQRGSLEQLAVAAAELLGLALTAGLPRPLLLRAAGDFAVLLTEPEWLAPRLTVELTPPLRSSPSSREVRRRARRAQDCLLPAWEQHRFVARARFHVAFDGATVEVTAAHAQPETVACIEARMQRRGRSLRRGPPVSGELSFGPARSTLFLRHDALPQGR